MSKYLDDTGLTYLWGKLKAYFQEKLVSGTNIKTINSESLLGSGDITISGGSSETFYGACSTAAATAAKVVTISNFTSSDLVAGVRVTVKFTNYNDASSPTLNVSGTGAIAIKKYSTTAVGSMLFFSWHSGEVIDFVYDGTYWMMANFSHKVPTVSATNTVLRYISSSGTPTWGKVTNSMLNSASATPTASYVAIFDSSKHMKSEDMSSADVASFVEGLTPNGGGIIDLFYPVGSYYETSDTSFDPNTSWGGTWELEAEGLVHIGAGSTYTVGATGGSSTHNHVVGSSITNTDQVAGAGVVSLSNYTGDSSSMQPYIVVNRWHRTA